ncbi:Imm49 family immunity protein [Streptomyces finlayi]|uniref:Imm49 family immunity protein n=1 Tax=Streptomyces finlayi TaxID=67296 RepID=UPI0034D583FE
MRGIRTAAGVEALASNADDLLEDIERSEISHGRVLDTTLIVAETSCELDPDAEELESWEAWGTAMQRGSARFAMATAPEGSMVTCRIKEEEWQLPASGPQLRVYAGSPAFLAGQ